MSEKKKASDFRYNTGETRVPWAAVGENYNVEDIMALLGFLIQKDGDGYNEALKEVEKAVTELNKYGRPPGKLSLSSNVAKLEEIVAEYLETKYVSFVTNATHGFEMAFKWANLGPGDEVIVPSITFAATMLYPLGVGAKVVFADVDPRTINMCPKDVERKITKRTKAIVPVHIGGWPVDMDPIMELARKHDIMVLEDAAHGFGGVYKGKKLGTIGDFGAYSFHEVKNITSFGEGGIVVCTNNYGEYLPTARFCGLDFSRKIENWLYDVAALPGKYGWFATGNYSTTEIQALGLISQMKRVDGIIEERRKNAEYLTGRFAENDAIIPQLLDTDEIKGTHHLYLLQIDPAKAGGNIQTLKKKLEDRGVTQIPHFGPLYKFDVLKKLGYDTKAIEKTCPNTEEVFNNRFTHLPVYGLTKDQLEYMADAVLDAVREMQAGK
ncbi:MAG: DegT/DnrJ/EryC1/StrS family aminotransferase [Sphaerochaetaceae bacterium]|jgi:perosamine synthetase|nr:DegT/DnrJ/EryC1/StrS family aminotransferase [Sphaerochaetaceae bacterium]HHU87965.1 DegT/DnrJ/EryC1/StrS family aminotransferase [Spirochaetales bacterium]